MEQSAVPSSKPERAEANADKNEPDGSYRHDLDREPDNWEQALQGLTLDKPVKVNMETDGGNGFDPPTTLHEGFSLPNVHESEFTVIENDFQIPHITFLNLDTEIVSLDSATNSEVPTFDLVLEVTPERDDQENVLSEPDKCQEKILESTDEVGHISSSSSDGVQDLSTIPNGEAQEKSTIVLKGVSDTRKETATAFRYISKQVARGIRSQHEKFEALSSSTQQLHTSIGSFASQIESMKNDITKDFFHSNKKISQDLQEMEMMSKAFRESVLQNLEDIAASQTRNTRLLEIITNHVLDNDWQNKQTQTRHISEETQAHQATLALADGLEDAFQRTFEAFRLMNERWYEVKHDEIPRVRNLVQQLTYRFEEYTSANPNNDIEAMFQSTLQKCLPKMIQNVLETEVRKYVQLVGTKK